MTIPVASVKITAVSYLNTLPFIYGIERQVGTVSSGSSAENTAPCGDVLLSLQIPSECVREACSGQTDIALIPAAAIPLLPETLPVREIITDYCIGAEGQVDSVALYSNSPLPEIHKIYLDHHSRTSVALARILAEDWWGIAPQWIDASDVEKLTLKPGEAFVAIGDKTFDINGSYTYKYDLAEEWAKLTGGMPFVFAAWVACSERGLAYAPTLNAALRYGTEHIAEAITGTQNRSRDFDFPKAYRYLTEHIRYNLDDAKRKAMALFWEKIITPG